MKNHIKYCTYILLAILGMLSVSFVYYGITNLTPYSADYNIPVAESIASGSFLFNQEGLYIHSPGASHIFLAAFMVTGIPLNLFGLLSWVVLFIVCKKLGDVYGLDKYMALLFAGTFCTTIAVVRTIGDQSIDKWLCTWFVLSMVLLEKPKKSIAYFLFLGFSLGMLIGTKYSGPLFFLALLPIYLKPLLHYLSPLRFIAASTTFTIFGLFWYIRNWIYEGNPYYPANIPFFKGVPNFTQQDWMLWKIPFEYPEGILPLVNSFISEYMIWAFAGFVMFWSLYTAFHNKKPLDERLKRLIWLSITTGFVCLLLPITPAYEIELFHIISDMRYVYIYMVILILFVFVIADKNNRNALIALLVILNAVPVFNFIPYQPKLFLIVIGLCILLYFKNNMASKLFNKF